MELAFAPAMAVGTFAAVIAAIASNRLHLTVAALLGVVALLLTGVLSAQALSDTIDPGEETIALFFGGMVMARVLIPTGLFEYLAAIALRLVRGDGRRLVLAVIIIGAPICAILPNATVVILVAPIIIRICRRLNLDFMQPVILLVFIANSAGLLTLVGDPATFIVGSSIRLSFIDYLKLLSPGGLLAIVVVLALSPVVFRSIWSARMAPDMELATARIERPWVMVAYLIVLVAMIALFVFGEDLRNPIRPPAVAIVGATLALLVAYFTRIDKVGDILRDLDWETLLFFVCIFVLVGALDKTGVIGALGKSMGELFGRNILLASFLLLFGIGALSSIIPNIPLVVAMVPLVKQYSIGAGLATTMQIEAGYSQMPAAVLPMFFAMCLGATLGGNATLLGASSNIVASGICAQNGRPVTFMTFLRYGIPVTVVQLVVAAAYLSSRFL
jgi:Na+/H+ antiporter NhaD/arsenite permease-like protein